MEFLTPDWVRAAVAVGWLLLAILIFALAFPLLVRIVRERAFSVEIAGFKLSAQESVETLNSAIKDLQDKVHLLEARAGAPAPGASPAPAAFRRGGSILWVDDYPINNALILERLEDEGYKVERALSTREGLKQFGRRAYDIVLSDMGRREDGAEIADAGVRLVEAIRNTDPSIPIVVFCSARARELYGQRALDAGANHVTSSAVELYALIEDATVKGA